MGCKTAINHPLGKNMIGAFYQPQLVVCDLDTLDTLPARELAAGLAEVIKYGVIQDAALFDMIPYDESEEEDIVRRCVEIKQQVVAQDLYDRGERQLLNFGHSFGHAVERLSGYEMSHGQAVAIGMCLMARAAEKKALCSKEDASRLIGMIRVLGLETECPYTEEEIYNDMLVDKKRSGDHITLVMFHGIGDCRLQRFSLIDARQLLRLGLEA